MAWLDTEQVNLNGFAELGRLLSIATCTQPLGCFATFGKGWKTEGAEIGKDCARLKAAWVAGSSIPSLSKIADCGAHVELLAVSGLEFLLSLRC